MYNGGNGSYNNGSYGTRPLTRYLIIGLIVALALWLVVSLIRPGIDGYFALVAGALLLVGNVRDLIAPGTVAQRSNSAMFNTMLGGSLVSFWLARGSFPPIGALWYVPAVALLLLAAPLILRNLGVYTAYIGAARSLADGARRLYSGVTRIR